MIYHIALPADWDRATRIGDYRVSTRDRTLDEVGFIHCSDTPDQVRRVANAFYRDLEEPLSLLVIDPDRLHASVVRESPDGGPELFPHLYGPLNLDAVVEAHDYRRADDGQFPAP